MDNVNKIGLLWNDLGVLKCNTEDVLYNQGTMEVDCSAASNAISGINDGYIEFHLERREQLSLRSEYFQIDGQEDGVPYLLSMYDRPNGLTKLVVLEDLIPTINYEFELPSKGTFRLEFSDQGNKLTLNGSPLSVDVLAGSLDVGVLIPSQIDTFKINNGRVGYMLNFTIGDTEDRVRYTGIGLGATLVDDVSGNDGVYIDIDTGGTWGVTTPEIIGFRDYPDYTKNFYIPPVPPSPFTPLTQDLSEIPSDKDRAFMRYKDTKEPILLSANGASYPIWSAIPISNMERNPDCWYYKKAMTCFSVQSEFHGFAGKITAISPRHGIIAEHIRDDFPNWDSKKFWFMDMNGNTQELNGIDYENIVVGGGLGNIDVTVIIFSEDITLDIDYATFMTDADANSYNTRDVTSVSPSKEGIFSIEKESQMCSVGLPYPIKDNPEYLWSRWNNPDDDSERVGDSSTPAFFYNDDTLYYMFSALFKSSYAWSWPSPDSECIRSPMDRGMNNETTKDNIKIAMDLLDTNNSRAPNFNLVEVPIA